MQGKQVIKKRGAKLKFNINKLRQKLLSMCTQEEAEKLDEGFYEYIDVQLESAIELVCDKSYHFFDGNEWLFDYSKDEIIWLAFGVRFYDYIDEIEYFISNTLMLNGTPAEVIQDRMDAINFYHRATAFMYNRLIYNGGIKNEGNLFHDCVIINGNIAKKLEISGDTPSFIDV